MTTSLKNIIRMLDIVSERLSGDLIAVAAVQQCADELAGLGEDFSQSHRVLSDALAAYADNGDVSAFNAEVSRARFFVNDQREYREYCAFGRWTEVCA